MPGSIVPLPVMLDEEDQKIYDRLEPPKTMVVRYGQQKLVAEYPYEGDAKPGCGSKLVVRTDRGTEIAEMLTTTCPNSGCYKSVSRQEMLDYIENSGGKDYPFSTRGKVLRVATVEDLNEQSALEATASEKIKACRQHIRELDLPMKLVEVEQILGGERIIFYFTAEDRVDFRELVKRLAADFATRIEMVQVNHREEARLVADYEKCGQYCCCKNFLKVLKPVSMRSAKVQKATLDPHKISGRCGRLMCCLRYEDQTYADLKKNLPHRKSRVRTEDGEGIVLSTQILTQLVLVALDDGSKPSAYPLEHIELLPAQQGGGKKKKRKPRGEGGDDPGKGKAGEARQDRPREKKPRSDRDDKAQGETQGERSGKRRRGPRRPKPGKPLQNHEVESKEGDNSANLPPDTQAASDGAPGDKPKKRRRRRRRRKPRNGGEGGGGSDRKPGGDGGNGGGGETPSG